MYQRALPTPSGSGGDLIYTTSGTLEAFTAVNQEKTINTGLSEIKHFYFEGVTANETYIGATWLDVDRNVAKQIATVNSSAGTTAQNSGTNATGVITGTGAQPKISAISGGNITIKGGNNAIYYYVTNKWYAG